MEASPEQLLATAEVAGGFHGQAMVAISLTAGWVFK